MGERQPLDVELVLDGRSVASETRYAEAGAYVLVLSSCVPELGLELHSTYVGHPEVENRVTHLILGGGGPQRAATEAVVRPDGELPVVFARRRCLSITSSAYRTSWPASATRPASRSAT